MTKKKKNPKKDPNENKLHHDFPDLEEIVNRLTPPGEYPGVKIDQIFLYFNLRNPLTPF